MNDFCKSLVFSALVIFITAGSGCVSVGNNNNHYGNDQFPAAPANGSGFDRSRLEVLHANTKRLVDEKKHAGIITLILHDGKIVDFQTYGYRDLEKQYPMERDTICRM